MELLAQFDENNMQIMAFVIDEYGEIEGIVTLQDMLEAVTKNEFTSMQDPGPSSVKMAPGCSMAPFPFWR